jgi:hypothetical protein
VAEDSLMQAMKLSSVGAAPAQVRERDLSYLSLASGDPDQVIASLEPRVSRDDQGECRGWESNPHGPCGPQNLKSAMRRDPTDRKRL